jgi:hypothetical protein
MAAAEPERYESEKNVLVMCQRKTGKCSSDTTNNVQDEGRTIDKINTFFSDYFKDKHVNIEYLTDLTVWRDVEHDTADYNFPLIRTNSEAHKFMDSHTNFYDAVMLNTCPLHNIDFLAILTILKEGGRLIIKNFGCDDNPPMSLDSPPFKAMNSYDKDVVLNVINSYFDTTGSSTIFVKNSLELGGGTRKRKQRHHKRSNRKTKLRRLKKLK